MSIVGRKYLLENEIPAHLECRIGLTLMRNPVTLPGDDDRTIDRIVALRSLEDRNLHPLTRVPVPPGRLPKQRELQRQAADVIGEAARFQRAFGDPREAAARTIQAAWVRHSASKPDTFYKEADVQKAKKLREALIAVGATGMQAEHARKASALGRAYADIGTNTARRAKDYARQARSLPVLNRVTIRWPVVAAATDAQLARRLREALEAGNANSIASLPRLCEAAGVEYSRLILADQAAPLRWLADQGRLGDLARAATGLPPVGHITGTGPETKLFATNMPLHGGRYTGELPFGRGVHVESSGIAQEGEWSNGVPHGLMVVRHLPTGKVAFAGQMTCGAVGPLGEALIQGHTYAGEFKRNGPNGFGTGSSHGLQTAGEFSSTMLRVGRVQHGDATLHGQLCDVENEICIGESRSATTGVTLGVHYLTQPSGQNIFIARNNDEHMGTRMGTRMTGLGGIRHGTTLSIGHWTSKGLDVFRTYKHGEGDVAVANAMTQAELETI